MKNPPIAYNPLLNAVMLRNGTLVPVERYARHNEKVKLATPRSRKEARHYRKTLRLARKRFTRDPIGYLNAYLAKKHAPGEPWMATR